jgi:PAS domain S-box-containing protein
MDGMELASRLHDLSQLTEVVVLTGNASVESAVAALRQHSVDYLLKPVNVDRLLQVASVATERWQRKHAEVRLRESDERFRRVVESDMMGIMFWETDGAITDGNDAFLEMIGYSRGDLAAGALDWTKLTPPEYDQLDRAKLAEVAGRGVVEPYEKELIRLNGSRVPILIGAATLMGRRDSGVCFVLDITARKEAERAAAARASQQAAVAELGRRALGLTELQVLFDAAVRLVADTLVVPLAAVFERRLDGSSLVMRAGTGSPPMLESDIGSGVSVAIPGPVNPFGILAAHARRPRTFTVDDEHFLQAMAHILGTAVERNRSDRASRQTQRLEAVGRLASGVAHDFNNMLTVIGGFSELVKEGLGKEHPLQDDVAEIIKAGRQAAGLTRQLLAFSRQQVLQPRIVCINDVVTEMATMVQRLVGNRIELIISLDPDLGSIMADPSQIEQVILNLCVNARDAMPDGGRLTIETSNTELDITQTHEHSIEAVGSYVRLCVSDTGLGMDAATKLQIFEPFFTTKSPDKGTGLGLATVYGIVKQSGGEIGVDSEPKCGATFKLFFPRTYAGVAGAKGPAGGLARNRPTQTILLIDDDAGILGLLRRMLETAGYAVISASSGMDAIRVTHDYRGPIDLIIAETGLPEPTGSDVVAHLRHRWPAVRALHLSPAVGADGEVGYLEKPFVFDPFIAKVRGAFEKKGV